LHIDAAQEFLSSAPAHVIFLRTGGDTKSSFVASP
jgi:hypothetical protein